MAKNFFLYGSSPSELASQQRGYEQSYTGAAESNRAASIAAQQFNLNAARDQQRADEEAMLRDNAVMRQQEQAKRANFFADRGYADSRAAAAQAIEFRNKYEIPRYVAETNSLAQKSPQAVDAKRSFQELATQNSNDGRYISVEQFKELHKKDNFSDNEAQLYVGNSLRSREKTLAAREPFEQAADALNKEREIGAEKKLVEGLMYDKTFFESKAPGTPYDDYRKSKDGKIAALDKMLAELKPYIDEINNAKNPLKRGLVMTGGKWKTTLPKLPWEKMDAEQSSPKQTTTGTFFTPTPATPETSTATPSVVVKTPKTPNGKPTQGGYKIGVKYGGGLTYLGGDFNQPENWSE